MNAALIVGLILILGMFVLKPLFGRARPFVAYEFAGLLIPPPSGDSFPSNHSSRRSLVSSVSTQSPQYCRFADTLYSVMSSFHHFAPQFGQVKSGSGSAYPAPVTMGFSMSFGILCFLPSFKVEQFFRLHSQRVRDLLRRLRDDVCPINR